MKKIIKLPNEDEVFKATVTRMLEEMRQENIQRLVENLKISKQIMDKDVQLDNAPDSFETILRGVRRWVVLKNGFYWLYDPIGVIKVLYFPTKHRCGIKQEWLEDNPNIEDV